MGTARVKLATLCYCLFSFLAAEAKFPSPPPLKVGFYQDKCPSAESIVRRTVHKFVAKSPGFAPGLVRMYFHDCFVRGCDASVLLDSLPGAPAEKDSPANNPSLRGFEVIDEAKARLESICPSTVSCSDILTFAARDASLIAGGINYAVPSGRRDGRVSLIDDIPQNLPPPNFNADQLKENFARKGLTLDEMVTLSGAHSFGVSHCSSFADRLYGFNATHPQDPSLDPLFASFLKQRCPRTVGGASDPTVMMDLITPNRLDNAFYVNLERRRGLFGSDQMLYDSELTRRVVEENARRAGVWGKKFGKAMVKMGAIEVLTGRQGEIRRKCNVVN
ncbi:uncharacterized protein A4U43_C07F11440 [Asparagus officinalis]|uniref:Peroxidase n=1 Tax=Asparagus officinalis TaxID=4686 RepID=A0A5P1EB63_ASPOF|nr:peroxidase 5-like [Asparagus officinalis]ONK63102.1 uncharacterized protein A4U43_C07F11440 [Asparagus officinalis]